MNERSGQKPPPEKPPPLAERRLLDPRDRSRPPAPRPPTALTSRRSPPTAPHSAPPTARPGCERLSALDASFLALADENSPPHVGAVAVFCGEADFATEKLAELEQVTGIDHVLGWTRLGGLAEDLITAHMERMRDRVMPALR